MKSSQQAKYELAHRKAVEDEGLQWHWVHNHDGPDGYQIDPSYESPGQIGYAVPCDRERADSHPASPLRCHPSVTRPLTFES